MSMFNNNPTNSSKSSLVDRVIAMFPNRLNDKTYYQNTTVPEGMIRAMNNKVDNGRRILHTGLITVSDLLTFNNRMVAGVIPTEMEVHEMLNFTAYTSFCGQKKQDYLLSNIGQAHAIANAFDRIVDSANDLYDIVIFSNIYLQHCKKPYNLPTLSKRQMKRYSWFKGILIKHDKYEGVAR